MNSSAMSNDRRQKKPVVRWPGLFGFMLAAGAVVMPLTAAAEEMAGVLQWVRTVPMSTPVSGVIAEVMVNKGDRVRSEQILLQLRDAPLQAALVASKAMLKRSENDFVEAKRELERTQELYDRTLLSDHDLQVAAIQRDAAEAKMLAAKSGVVNAERDVYYSAVRAPFDAWVLQRNAEPGQTVISRLQASPLIVLAEAGRMLARVLAKESVIARLKVGDAANVIVAGKKYDGKIHFVALEPSKSGGEQYVVDVIFNSGEQSLRVGQAAKVSF